MQSLVKNSSLASLIAIAAVEGSEFERAEKRTAFYDKLNMPTAGANQHGLRLSGALGPGGLARKVITVQFLETPQTSHLLLRLRLICDYHSASIEGWFQILPFRN